MISRLSCILTILLCASLHAQERTQSPYSFFGLGQQTFNGTIENRSMGGLRTFADSVHVNLRNPAAYGALRLTTYTTGVSHTETIISNSAGSENTEATNLEYLALGVPLGKRAAFGIGVLPFQAVGYDFGSLTSEGYNRFSGTGGLNRAFFTAGLEIMDGLSIGAEYRYNFGEEQNRASIQSSDIQYGTREINDADLSGSSFNFSLNYKYKLDDGRMVQASAVYSPESDITVENTRTLSAFQLSVDEQEVIIAGTTRTIELTEQQISLPGEFTFGLGLGRPENYFIAAEYSTRSTAALTNRSFTPAEYSFEDAASYRLGGYWTPDYNSISSYFNRMTYRAGLRYEETGLVIGDNDITEFGITFGIGFPVGKSNVFSSANLGLEYGQRGTTSDGLVQEEFFGFSVGLSLNDRWFEQRKYK